MEVKFCCLWFNALSGCANIWHFWLVMSHVISCLDSVTRFGKFGLIHLMCTAADTTKLRLITLPFYFFAKSMFFQPTPRNKFTQPVNLSLLWICTTVQLIVLPFLQDASMAAAFTQRFSDSAAQPLLWRRRALHCLEYRSLFLWWFLTPVVWSAAPVVWLPTDGRVEWWREKKNKKKTVKLLCYQSLPGEGGWILTCFLLSPPAMLLLLLLLSTGGSSPLSILHS